MGTVISAVFDDVMDMGIVGRTAGTLWYINWADSTSIRLISGHKSKVNGVVFSPDEQHFVTCGQDGSVRVWVLQSHELLVQFQVLNQSCECVCWSPPRGVYEPSGRVCVAGGYSDGTVRIFSLESAEMELKLQPQPVSVCVCVRCSTGTTVMCCCLVVVMVSLLSAVPSLESLYAPWSRMTHNYSAVHQQTGLCLCVCFCGFLFCKANDLTLCVMWNCGPYLENIWTLKSRVKIHEFDSKTDLKYEEEMGNLVMEKDSAVFEIQRYRYSMTLSYFKCDLSV